MFAKIHCSLLVAIMTIGAALGSQIFADDPKASKPEVVAVPVADWESISIEGDPRSNVSVPMDALGLFKRIELAGREKGVRYQLQIGDSTLEIQANAIASGASLMSPRAVHVAGSLSSVSMDAAQPDRKRLICIPTRIDAVIPIKGADWMSINLGFSVPVKARGSYQQAGNRQYCRGFSRSRPSGRHHAGNQSSCPSGCITKAASRPQPQGWNAC